MKLPSPSWPWTQPRGERSWRYLPVPPYVLVNAPLELVIFCGMLPGVRPAGRQGRAGRSGAALIRYG